MEELEVKYMFKKNNKIKNLLNYEKYNKNSQRGKKKRGKDIWKNTIK